MSESATFSIVAVQTGPSTYTYTMQITDTGTTAIGTFWFSWVPGAGYLPDDPTFTSPTGWTGLRTDGPPPTNGYSIQWVAHPGAALTPGQSVGGFTFTSQSGPATIFGPSKIHAPTPVTESTFYSGSPFSDAGAITAAASMQQEKFDHGVLTETDNYAVATGQPYYLFAYDYSPGGAYVGSQFFYASGEEVDYDGGGGLVRAQFADPVNSPYSSHEYDYLDGLFTGSKFTYTTAPAGASYSSYEIDYGAAGQFAGQKFFWSRVSGQSYSTEEEDFDANQKPARILLGGFSSEPYTSLELDYLAGEYQGYKAVYLTSGQSYVAEEVDVSATGQIERVVYSGVTGAPYQTVEQDYAGGAVDEIVYGFTNVSGQNYHAYRVLEDASGNVLQEQFDLNSGGHREIAFAPGQQLTSLGNDRMTGATSGATTFLFDAYYGAGVITNLTAQDTISLPSSEFSDASHVLAAATSVGGNMVITAADGDTLTLKNITPTTLASLSGNFVFHS